jgi:hypothetical protein
MKQSGLLDGEKGFSWLHATPRGALISVAATVLKTKIQGNILVCELNRIPHSSKLTIASVHEDGTSAK